MVQSAGFAARDRCVHEIAELCRAGADPSELLEGLIDRLRTQVDFEAAFVSATDPSTTLFAGAGVVENLPPSMCAPWLDNEFTAEDFNKFADLDRSGSGPVTLHRATFDRPARSSRHREINDPLGFSPELRATFSVDGECWGVVSLLRRRGEEDFTDDELDLVGSVSGLVADGLRRFVLTADARDPAPSAGPGVVLLDAHGELVSMTDRAAALLDELSHPPVTRGARALPGEAYVVGARARARAAGLPGPPPVVRTRTRSGGWLTLRADCSLDASGRTVSTAIVIEPARKSEMLPLFVAAYGLTPREEAVLAELVRGATTTEVARALVISPHTVRDHVKALHEKVGVRSRGELVSRLYQLEYAPGFDATHR